ncbi:MAG: hypothetical protein WBR18_06535 [Anaerolineales bacterium]
MNLLPFYRRPWFRTIVGLVLWSAAYWLLFRASAPERSPLALIFDLGLFGASFLLMVALAAQFVLPVRTWRDRSAVVQRLLDYALGSRGPVLFLRHGRTIESKGERSRRGPGVLLADHTSAGVLRTETRYTRSIGPGVTFTEPGERLAESLDLRRQIRTVESTPPSVDGGLRGDSAESVALTEDGIPISASLRLAFMLDPGHASTPREGQYPNQPPYEFNPRAAERAVYGHAHRADQSTAWTDLPMVVAIDLWREEVKRWRLESLLTSGGNPPTPLAQIEQAMADRLVITTQRKRDSADQPFPREMEVLRRRGIRVLSVEVSNLQVPEPVREEHLRSWRETWNSAAEEGVLEARGRGQEARWQGEKEGHRDLLRQATQVLRQSLMEGERPGRRDTLLQLLEGASSYLQEPELLADSGALHEHLRRIAAELRVLDGDCQGDQV